MKRSRAITIGVISFVALILFSFIMINLSDIETGLENFIVGYGIIGVFLVSLIVDLVPQPIGPEVAIIGGELLDFSPLTIGIVVILGMSVATLLNYRIGALFNKKLLSSKKGKKYAAFYKRYGKYALLIAALGPVPYVPFCWLSGMFRIGRIQYFWYALFPRTVRIILMVILFSNIVIVL